MIDILFILLFTIGVNWIVSLHYSFQSVETPRQKMIIILLSILIGIGLGVMAI